MNESINHYCHIMGRSEKGIWGKGNEIQSPPVWCSLFSGIGYKELGGMKMCDYCKKTEINKIKLIERAKEIGISEKTIKKIMFYLIKG